MYVVRVCSSCRFTCGVYLYMRVEHALAFSFLYTALIFHAQGVADAKENSAVAAAAAAAAAKALARSARSSSRRSRPSPRQRLFALHVVQAEAR